MPNVVIPMILGSVLLGALCGYAFHAGFLAAIGRMLGALFSNTIFKISAIALILGGLSWFISIQKRPDRGPVFCILVFIFFNALFWFAFEQAGSTLNVFADRSTDRVVFGWEIPTAWFQNFNSAFIVLLAPLFAWTWTSLGKRRMNPSQPVKISLGLIFLGLGYICMVLGAMEAMRGKVSPMYLVLTYLLHTMGELCLSPTGLSFVTKTAPVRFVSFLMGMWFLSSFVANLGGGLVAAQVTKIESGELVLPWSSWFETGSRAPFFMLFVITSLGAGLVILAFSPLLKRLLGDKVDA
jgi:POT family proton-dependent oligopeptide transporter